jgi:hypothetical protein
MRIPEDIGYSAFPKSYESVAVAPRGSGAGSVVEVVVVGVHGAVVVEEYVASGASGPQGWSATTAPGTDAGSDARCACIEQPAVDAAETATTMTTNRRMQVLCTSPEGVGHV